LSFHVAQISGKEGFKLNLETINEAMYTKRIKHIPTTTASNNTRKERFIS
jgi:hypothetical protein